MTMSTADRQVIEMANRPGERLDRMEKQAVLALRRRRVRQARQEEQRSRRARSRGRLQWAAAAMGMWAVIIGMVALAVVS